MNNVKADCKDAHKLNYLKMIEEVRVSLDKASRARINKGWLLNRAVGRENSAFEYAKMFKIRTPRKKITESEDIQASIATVEKQRQECEKRKAEKEAKKNAEMLARFRNGEPCGNCRLPDGTIPLRMRHETVDGQDKVIIETGLGAKVRFREAKLLWELWKKAMPLPGRIGSYEGISLNKDKTEMSIGCHTISRQEAERLFETEVK